MRYYLNPSILHFKAVDNIFAYLNKYLDLGIIYNRINNNDLLLKAYSDSN